MLTKGKRYCVLARNECWLKDAQYVPNSTSTSVQVTMELHEKHAHAYQVIAVFAFEPVDTIL